MAGEHKLGVGADVVGRVYSVLADPRYNVQKDQNDIHTENELFNSNDMKVMANVLGDIIKIEYKSISFVPLFKLLYGILLLPRKNGSVRK